jgi:dTDP-4-dehydrorhamnose reductase
MRLLVTGATGMLGRDIASAASAAGHELTALSRSELDITDAAAVQAAVAEGRPDAVLNCAAWTDVDGAETEAEQAFAVNGPGAGNVARAGAAAGAWTVHISSDYVFAGDKSSPYVESDPTGPKSQYGRGKLAGELAVAEAAPAAHTIVRSSWLFGAGGHCFPATILRVGAERDQLTVVDDQVGCPTFTGHLAPALVALAQDPILGILHVAGAGQCSWYDFSREIVTLAGLRCEVVPGATADLARPAPRPAYSVLATERAGTPVLPEWREGLQAFLAAGVPS